MREINSEFELNGIAQRQTWSIERWRKGAIKTFKHLLLNALIIARTHTNTCVQMSIVTDIAKAKTFLYPTITTNNNKH